MYTVCVGKNRFIGGLVNSVEGEAQGCLWVCLFVLMWMSSLQIHQYIKIQSSCASLYFAVCLCLACMFVNLRNNITDVFRLTSSIDGVNDCDVQTLCFKEKP